MRRFPVYKISPHRMRGFLLSRIFPVFLSLLLCDGLAAPPAHAVDSRKIEKMIEDTQTGRERELQERERQAVLDRGRQLYRRFCVHCHGVTGQGNGEASIRPMDAPP